MRFDDETNESEPKASAFVELPHEMKGDLNVTVEPAHDINSISLHVRVAVDYDTSVSIGSNLRADEAEWLTDRLQACTEEIREESE